MPRRLYTALAVGGLVALLLAAPLRAQEEPPPPGTGPGGRQPVMRNVFFNVVWGSAFGATLGASASVIGSDNPSRPPELRGATFNGATIGGLIGLGVGLYLVYTGITFDPAASIIAGNGAPRPGMTARAAPESPPFSLQVSREAAPRVTGFQARVLHLKF